ncbi:MAG TPA: creatininase family protein [Armatimonadota bacterium]|jgi:creatinine amidohydrolase|nr:creatininase family protein [Armatimonadota bacterium]HOM81327.1 creatininase family protein [Armatimonadota bacterium]HOQ28085.1 creatininase family protein [Armatimonadota bacterium]HPO72713.1 creatininase family protein [Armatimonadota bacterium]HPT97398.1 creatininase family protein [Armatimonadota bacterium]
MPKSRIMLNMTVQEIREALKETQTVILPIGCVEQHGYHLPISVDIHNAVELATRAAEETGCFVAPPVMYTFSGGFLPGTVNISPQLFALNLMEICHSLVLQGFRNIVLLLGHGGSENTRAAQEAAENFQRLNPQLEGVTIAVVPFWELSPTMMEAFEQGDYHAARIETSLMLFWHPELVRMEKATRDNPELVARMAADPDAYLVKEKRVDHPFVVARLTQDPQMEVGVMGDFAGASAELGRTVAEEATRGLVEFLSRLEG